MHVLKSKKGQTTEISQANLIDIGLAALTIILLLSFVYKASTGIYLEEKKIAINTGLMIDTIISSNGNTFLSTDIANNTLAITDTQVEAGEKLNQKFYLLSDQNINIFSDLTFKDTTKINLIKTGNSLYISKDITQISSLSCPFVFVDMPNNITIITETESITNNDLFIINLEQSLEQSLGYSELQIGITDNLIKNTELAIKIQTTNENIFKIEIPVNSIASRRLACTITNQIQIKNPELDTEIIVIEHPIFEKSDNAIILTINNKLKKLDTTHSLSNAFKLTFT